MQQAPYRARQESRRQQVVKEGVQPAVEVPNAAGDARHLRGSVQVRLLRAGAAALVLAVDAKSLLQHPPL